MNDWSPPEADFAPPAATAAWQPPAADFAPPKTAPSDNWLQAPREQGALAPVSHIPEDISHYFSEGAKSVKDAYDDYAKGGWKQKEGDPLASLGNAALDVAGAVGGGLEEATSIPLGIAHSLIARPITNTFGNGPVVSSLAEGLANAGSGIVGAPLAKLVEGGGSIASRLAQAAKSRPTADAVKTGEQLRQDVTSTVQQQQTKYDQQVAEYKKRSEAADAAIGQLKLQPKTAEGRATTRALKSTHMRGGTRQAFLDEKQNAMYRLQSQTHAYERDARQAGEDAEAAKAQAAHYSEYLLDAHAGVEKVEKDWLAKPRGTPEEFGADIQKATQTLYDKYNALREQASGVDAARQSAGDALRVNTSDIIKTATDKLKSTNTPQAERILKEVQARLRTKIRGEVDETKFPKALSLPRAESLRFYLEHVINTKMESGENIDHETVEFARNIKNQLLKTAEDSWEPYKIARQKYAEHSRPLDIINENAGLKNVIEKKDYRPDDYEMTHAQVMRDVIDKANEGNPVFSRLLAESPELQKSARLAFTQDLFGKDTPPTDTQFANWLGRNRSALQQLKLHDEFSTMHNARRAAQKAVSGAESRVNEAQAESKIFTQSQKDSERAAKETSGKSSTLLRQLEKREDDKQKEAGGYAKTRQDAATEAQSRLEYVQKKSAAGIEKAETVKRRLARFQKDLELAPPEKVHSEARRLINDLYSKGLISDELYDSLSNRVGNLASKHMSARERKQKITRALSYGLGVGILHHAMKDMLGHNITSRLE